MDEIKFIRRSVEKKRLLKGLYSRDKTSYEFSSPYGPVLYESIEYNIGMLCFPDAKIIMPPPIDSLIPQGYEFVKDKRRPEKALAKAREKASREEDPKAGEAKLAYISEWMKKTDSIHLAVLKFIEKEVSKEIAEEEIRLSKDKSIW
jgi:hypothetical protein